MNSPSEHVPPDTAALPSPPAAEAVAAGPRRRLALLVAAHVVAAGVATWFGSAIAWPAPANVLLTAVNFSQLALLGIWAALGRGHWGTRLAGVGVGIGAVWLSVSLELLHLMGANFSSESWRIVWLLCVCTAALTACVAAALAAIRFWVARLERLPGAGPAPQDVRLQFSILHLLILTAAVAAFLALARTFRAIIPSSANLTVAIGLIYATYIVGTVAIALAAVWATLAAARPPARIAAVLALSALLGPALPFFRDGRPGEMVASSAMHLIMTLLIVASLLVVRSCGYRLVPLRPR